MADYTEIKNKIENGTNNCDINNKYYVSESEMAYLINSMVSYEVEIKPIFKHDVIADTNNRIIIQQKCPYVKEDCSICLNSLFHKQVAYLPCKHYFHSACLTQAFKNKLYTCPLCRTDLNTVLNKIGFQFPPAQPEQISDIDLDLIYRLLESSLYYTYVVPTDDIANYYRDNPLLYIFDFNLDDIEQMMSNNDDSYSISDDGDGV
jgi:hypothetical protein